MTFEELRDLGMPVVGAIARTTPALFGLFSVVTLLAMAAHRGMV